MNFIICQPPWGNWSEQHTHAPFSLKVRKFTFLIFLGSFITTFVYVIFRFMYYTQIVNSAKFLTIFSVKMGLYWQVVYEFHYLWYLQVNKGGASYYLLERSQRITQCIVIAMWQNINCSRIWNSNNHWFQNVFHLKINFGNYLVKFKWDSRKCLAPV